MESGFEWTKVKSGNMCGRKYSTVLVFFFKSPPRGSSDLIYKIEQRKKNEKKTNLQI